MQLDHVYQAFFSKNEQIVCKPYGTGHIHETFLITLPKSKQQFILQKINHSIFKQVNLLQENILKVTAHIQKELLEKDSNTSQKKIVEVLKTVEDKNFFRDKENNFWRCFYFISKSKTYDQISSPELAFQAGMALGQFIRLLGNFPVGSLHITLPDFHNLEFRLMQFHNSLDKNLSGRLNEISEEIDFIEKRAKRFQDLLKTVHEIGIQTRVMHNDPKINNILFDENDKAICVIDLDTVMPGYIYHDFGDAIRTGASSAAEDESDTDKMFVRLDLFEAYTNGFLSETSIILTKTEISLLAIAPQLMTFIIGTRFLTDYINGDIYFKTKHKKHNLERWFAQKALLISMEENEAEMKNIVLIATK